VSSWDLKDEMRFLLVVIAYGYYYSFQSNQH